MVRFSKISLCGEAHFFRAKIAPKKVQVVLEDRKEAGSKIFLSLFCKGFRPPSGHTAKFFIHAHSWLKWPLHIIHTTKFEGPFWPPPLVLEGGYFGPGVTSGCIPATLTKFGPNRPTLISADCTGESWNIC